MRCSGRFQLARFRSLDLLTDEELPASALRCVPGRRVCNRKSRETRSPSRPNQAVNLTGHSCFARHEVFAAPGKLSFTFGEVTS